MKVFKIRQKETGLFSTGGMRPTFVKQGKVWQQLRHVHSHIAQLTSAYTPPDVYKDAEIVEAEITEILSVLEPASDYLIQTYDKYIEANQERIARGDKSTWPQDNIDKYEGRKAALKWA